MAGLWEQVYGIRIFLPPAFVSLQVWLHPRSLYVETALATLGGDVVVLYARDRRR
jgi:hypothetical protein